jgi:hypothetical protein
VDRAWRKLGSGSLEVMEDMAWLYLGDRPRSRLSTWLSFVHRLPNITKVVGKALEAAAVRCDGHITLAEGMELGLDVHRTSGSVVTKETLDGDPDVEGSFFRLHHHVLQLVGTGGVESISNGGVIHCPLQLRRRWEVRAAT